jgi:hypothetical protein
MACIFDRIHHTKSMEAKEKEPMVETFGNYSIETIYRVYNDKSGEYIEVGPDADGIGLIEIRMYTDDGKISQRVMGTSIEMKLVAEAILKSCQ